MKVKELVGKDIMMAYDGDYLSSDFGYSCANFNVRWMPRGNDNWRFFDSYKYGGRNETENDEATFDFYTINKKNVSCFVCFDENRKICGRRMFFKGPSLVNDDEFDSPIKKGELVKYLYGYYGNRDYQTQKEIGIAAFSKYGKGILYTDENVLRDGTRDWDIPNYWIMEVDRTDFAKYPPIDHLSVSTDINALANFEPRRYIMEILEKEFKKRGIRFHRAYRFAQGKVARNHNYTTWADHQGIIKSYKDLIKPSSVQEEEEEEDEVRSPINPQLLLPPPTNEPNED
jgi:hypothetical protein